MAYIGTQPRDIRSFGKADFSFTATQGQTVFTGADNNGKTLAFTVDQVQVYVNGIRIDPSDYTLSTNNTVTLNLACNAGDIINVVALRTEIPNNDYTPPDSALTTDSVGHTGLNTTSPVATLHITDVGTTGPVLHLAGGSSTEGDITWPHNETMQIGYWNSGTSTFTETLRLETDGDLHADGNVIAYSTTISDERLKKDVERIDNALDKICALSGYTFTYVHDDKVSAGVIAQEVEKVLPSAVIERELAFQGDDGVYKIVQYDQLHGLLIEAIKELKEEIQEVKDASRKQWANLFK